jgi:hypothetical protein
MAQRLHSAAAAAAQSRYGYVVVFFGAVLNTFVPFFSGPLTLLFCTLAAAQPSRHVLLAVLNAAGAAAGMTALYLLVAGYGTAWLEENFPSLMQKSSEAAPSWLAWLQDYLLAAKNVPTVIVLCALPVMIQPLALLLGTVAPFSGPAFFSAVLAGRFVKYFVMATLASAAPGYVGHRMEEASAAARLRRRRRRGAGDDA